MNRKVIFSVISIAIIEDIKEIREALKEFLKTQPNFLCEVASDSVQEFMKQVDFNNPPDVLLLDIGLPGISGIVGMKLIKEKIPDVDIIMLTVYDDHNKIFQSICAGATGYLLKNTPLPKIKEAIEEVASGGSPMSPQIARAVLEYFSPHKILKQNTHLTEKEKQVVACLVDGSSYKMIASQMNNSIETIRHHIKNIYKKLHVNSKSEVVSKSLRGEI
ncbi:MAG: response regulator transcription factor [Ignavibacteriales bacterium]|nr:response regulator transcription factor [Ignavibacteriales bacterium]